MTIIDFIEYSVCEDCLLYIGDADLADYDACEDGENRERERAGGKDVAHFVTGIEPTEDDPEGRGYEEFSWHECELCRSSLGGSRHGVTLLITKESEPC